MMEFYGHPRANQERVSARFGFAVGLASNVSSYCRLPLGVISRWLMPPVVLNQIRFIFDNRGQPVGYVTYAFLTEISEARLLKDEVTSFEISEWREGDRVWIIDLVAAPGYLRSLVTYIKIDLADCSQLKYMRRDRSGNVQKIRIATQCMERWRVIGYGADK